MTKNRHVSKFKFLIALCSISLSACQEVKDNRNASGEVPTTGRHTDGSNFFNAHKLSLSQLYTDDLQIGENEKYYVFDLPTNQYQGWTIGLKNHTGEMDLELYNAYFNRISWTDKEGLDEEIINYWRDYTDLDNNIVFVKAIKKTAGPVDFDFYMEAQ